MTKVKGAEPSAQKQLLPSQTKAAVVYHPTRTGVFLRDPDDPARSAALKLRGHTVIVHWICGFAPEVVEKAAREWYPMARKVVFPNVSR